MLESFHSGPQCRISLVQNVGWSNCSRNLIRNTQPGIVDSMRVRDVDGDGRPDLVCQMKTMSTLKGDTARLSVSLATKDGVQHRTTVAVQSTTLSSTAVWKQQAGADWQRQLKAYSSGKLRTWW